MDLIEAITTRKSIRAYKPDPVPQEILKEIMAVSLRAPSAVNSQPWEFIVLGGEVWAEVKQALVQKLAAREPANPDIPATRLPEEYLERQRAHGRRVFEVLGIAREDREKRQQWYIAQGRAFDAPNGIIICMDRVLPSRSIMDIGMIIQTIALAALSYGLGTCIQAMLVSYPEVLRKVLNISESKLLVCGMAIGYPDWDFPVNQLRSDRLPLEALVSWRGFDQG